MSASLQLGDDSGITGLQLDEAILPPGPAWGIQARLRIHAVVDGVDYHLDVPLRLHVPTHDAKWSDGLPHPGRETRE